MLKRTKKKPFMIIAFILCMLLYCIVYSVTVYAEELPEDDENKTLAPYFMIKDGDPQTDSFPLKDTKVSTTISGVIADTYITQTYTNEGTNPIHGTYVFPASTQAAVHGMTMQIGDQLITATIKEKEEAKEEFEEAKESGKSASLLQQQRSNVFTMDVANIMPGDTIKIELHYTELISPVEGTYEFVFPTVVGPRYVSPSDVDPVEKSIWAATPYIKAEDIYSGTYDISVRLSTGVPIADLICESHDITVAYNNEADALITLSDSQDFAGNRDFILDYRLAGDEITSGLMLSTGDQENFFLLTVQPPERYTPEEILPREYIFILDVSGSMSGYPLDTAKELIRDLVSGLRKTDRFNVILFSNEYVSMSPASVPATQENIARAIALIDGNEGGGGTELAPALQEAISIPAKSDISRSIVTITDGYIYGDQEIFSLILENMNNASFFSFGIGDSVNRNLIEGMAKCGAGESFVVTNAEDAPETAERFRAYIEAPILTDIAISYEGFNTYDVQPAIQPTLFAAKPIVVYGKWSGDADGIIRVTGKSGSQEYTQEISVADATALDDSQAISYLWARNRVEQLTTYAPFPDEDVNREAITALGLKYSMATPYTSFIAVTDIVRNADGEATDVNQPLPMPSNVSNLAIGGYTVGAEPSGILLFIIAVPLLLFRLRRRKAKEIF